MIDIYIFGFSLSVLLVPNCERKPLWLKARGLQSHKHLFVCSHKLTIHSPTAANCVMSLQGSALCDLPKIFSSGILAKTSGLSPSCPVTPAGQD